MEYQTILLLLLSNCAVFAGALLKGGVGFGFAMLVAPVFLIFVPQYLPATLLWVQLWLSLVYLIRDHKAIQFHGLGMALIGRFVGTGVAFFLLRYFTERHLEISTVILMGGIVVVLAMPGTIAPTKKALSIAGFFSGITSTILSISGAPMAPVLRDSHAKSISGMMAGFNLVGIGISLIVLYYHRIGTVNHIKWGVLLLPGAVLGVLYSKKLHAHLNPERVRIGLLILVAISTVIALVRIVDPSLLNAIYFEASH